MTTATDVGIQRLDRALVDRGLARSRTQAALLIADGRVLLNGKPVGKAAALVSAGGRIEVSAGEDWASRGAHKLRGALAHFSVDVDGRRAVDAGASTGGFTDVLLRAGASAVAAIDVGAGQLDPTLATDPRVKIHDRLNIRELAEGQAEEILAELGGPAQVVVADLSFISLTLVLPALLQLAASDADLLPMVKPQFEVGRERLRHGGVVRSSDLRAEAVAEVAHAAARLGLGLVDAVASSLPGPNGNVEYFLHLRADASRDPIRAEDLVRSAVGGGTP